MTFHDLIAMNFWVLTLCYTVSLPFRLFLYLFYHMGADHYD